MSLSSEHKTGTAVPQHLTYKEPSWLVHSSVYITSLASVGGPYWAEQPVWHRPGLADNHIQCNTGEYDGQVDAHDGNHNTHHLHLTH